MISRKKIALSLAVLLAGLIAGCEGYYRQPLKQLTPLQSRELFESGRADSDRRRFHRRSGDFKCRVIGSIVAVYAGNPIFPIKDWAGSDVVVGDGRHVLTAYHVMEHCQDFWVERFTCPSDGGKPELGDAVAVQAVAWSYSADVGILKVNGPQLLDDPLPVAPVEPEVGSPVWLFGARSFGTVGLKKANPRTEGFSAFVRGEALPGDPGGAMVDAPGRLAGLAVGQVLDDRFYAYMPIDEVIKALVGQTGVIQPYVRWTK